jgi:NADH-quinone oxidoreductase subunit I
MKAVVEPYRWARDMIRGFATVLTGMGVTMRHFVSRPVTMHYPDEKWKMPEGFRGMIKCDVEACIVCDLCAKACPVDCITIRWNREEGKSGKNCLGFTVDYQKCLYCGLCTYPCPTFAIFHSHEYEVATYSRAHAVVDWALPAHRVKNPNAKPKQEKKPAKPPPKKEEKKAEAAAAPATVPPPAAEGVASGVPGKAAQIGTRGKVKNVWIIDGCIVCDLCEDTAPDVFKVTETTSTILPDHKDRWGELSDAIIDAAVGCPVNVIHYELE